MYGYSYSVSVILHGPVCVGGVHTLCESPRDLMPSENVSSHLLGRACLPACLRKELRGMLLSSAPP